MNRPTAFAHDVSDQDSEYIPILGDGKSLLLHSGRVLLQPGQECGRHSTKDHEELIIVLSGQGELEVEGLGRQKIRAGMVAYNPPQTEHNVFNTGNEPLSYVYVVTPTAQSTPGQA